MSPQSNHRQWDGSGESATLSMAPGEHTTEVEAGGQTALGKSSPGTKGDFVEYLMQWKILK